MKTVTFPLKQHDKGIEVANLQDVLKLMLEREAIYPGNPRARTAVLAKLPSERETQTYGPATHEIVTVFQQERHLRQDGSVGRQTADAINMLLKEWGLLVQPLPAQDYTVQGTIYDKTGKTVSGLIVRALDDDPHSERDLLGTAVTDKAGRYVIAYDRSRFARPHESGGADIIVVVYSPEGGQLYESRRHPNAPKHETIEIRLRDYPVEEETVVHTYTLGGYVADDKGVGIAGMVVEAFALDSPMALRTGGALGSPGLSGDDGSYEIEITRHVPKSRIESPMDITLTVSDPSGKELSRTAQYDIAAKRAVNVIISADHVEEPSEFENLGAAILRHVEQPDDLRHLKENDEEQGITYLSHKTRWDARLVGMHVLAQRYGSDAVPAEFLYTLYRSGVPSTKDELYRLNIDKAMERFEQAIKRNIIPIRDYDTARIRTTFQVRSNRHILKSKSPVSVSTVGEMLSLSLTTEEERADFVDLYYHGDIDLESRWERIEARFGDKAKAVRFDGQMGYLSLNNVGLIRQLKERLEPNDPLDLVKKGLYEEDAWDTFLNDDVAIPEVFLSDTVEEGRTRYKQWMALQLKRSYPTPVIAEKIRRGTIGIDGSDDLKTEVYNALYANGFVLGQDSVNRHIETLESLSDAAKNELRRVHRTYQLSPSDEMMSRLLDLKLDIDAAFKICKYDERSFTALFSAAERDEAVMVLRKARTDVALIANTVLGYQMQKTNPTYQVVGGSGAETAKTYPKLEELFGDLDYCACNHCESILSPAAYFVDLLQFIDGTNSPLTQLLKRRPDLEHIDLTCENTETVLPYVDLVNEILEYWVSHSHIHGFRGYNTEEGVTSEALLASPENVDEIAYETIEEAVFPMKLPFSRNMELIRNYFGSVKVPLCEAMETLQRDETFAATVPDYGWREVFTEQLGLSPALFAVLTDSVNYPVETLYGYAPDDDLNSVMPHAKAFCRRLGVEYEELIALLKTRFVNPVSRQPNEQAVLIPVEATQELRGCSFEAMQLGYLNGEPLGVSEYLKLERFVRLRKQLGWSIEKTDEMIEALTGLGERLETVEESEKPKALDDGFEELIIMIALFERVRKALNAKAKEYGALLVLWRDLGTAPQPQNMTLEEIAAVDGYRQLVTWLKLSVEELLDAIVLSGIDPLGSFEYLDENGRYSEPDLLRFIAFIQKVRGSKSQVSELNYLFREKDVTGADAPARSELFGMLAMLHGELRELVGRYPLEGMLSEEKARELLLAVYGEAETNAIVGIFGETRSFATEYAHPSEELSMDITNVDNRLRYDHLKKALIFDGMMREDVRDAFKDDGLGVSDAFKAAIDDLYNQAEAVRFNFVQAYPELEEFYVSNATLSSVVSSKLPDLIKRMQYVFVEQLLSDQLDIEPEMAKVLFERDSEDSVLHTASGSDPMLSDFVALQKNGISASYYNDAAMTSLIVSEMRSGTIAFGPEDPLPENTDNPTLPISALWHFCLMPETTSDCNLYLEVSPGAGVSLSIDGESVAGHMPNGVWSNDDRISLEAGRIYEVRIEVSNIGETAILRWEQGGRFKEPIPTVRLLPYESVQNYRRSYRRLLKVLQWIRGAALLPEEVRYFAREYLDKTIFDAIPVDVDPDLDKARELCALFLEIADFNDLKRCLGVQDETLVAFFQKPQATYTVEGAERSLLYKMVQWSKEDVDAVVRHFKGDDHLQETEQELADTGMLSKAADLFELLEQSGISAAEMIACCTPYPGADTVSQIREALQNRYDEETWLKLSQTVHDKMRTAQRDALVAYILHALESTADDNIDTPNKLFEYFLIDVEMDACMKTSRIKQAISSVQLFIERCLHNIEQDIAPEAIDAKQWEWRKRYRVWEANRKVFLYPENWLDPSLRSTKSPFFKDFESEMLQSDINDDLAAKALLNYLEKLDRVSQLEMCGLCREYEDQEETYFHIKLPKRRAWSNKIHVIGRTEGIKREYYHRCYDGATWSAWEKIALDLEEGPVIPVFWKGRLFLFWTTVIQKGQDGKIEKKDGEVDVLALNGPPKIKVEINLNWSEFYNGKWQDKRTSDFMNPVIFTLSKLERNDIRLGYEINKEDTLSVYVARFNIRRGRYDFYNTHSIPELFLEPAWTRNRQPSFSHKLITNNFRSVDFAHPLVDVTYDPLFLYDYRHAFFVDPEEMWVSLSDVGTIGTESPGLLIPDLIPELEEEVVIDPNPIPDPVNWKDVIGGPVYKSDVSKVMEGESGFVFDEVTLGAFGQNIKGVGQNIKAGGLS
jgi:hypothetical protein